MFYGLAVDSDIKLVQNFDKEPTKISSFKGSSKLGNGIYTIFPVSILKKDDTGLLLHERIQIKLSQELTKQKLEGKTFISDQEIDDLIDNALKDSLNQTQLHK
jgi:hypothetical protein